MNIVLITIGSHGDVHPFIGIGQAMQRRGHRVTVITNDYFGPLIRNAGLAFDSFASAENYLQIAQHPDIWHRTRAWKVVFGTVLDTLEIVYEKTVKHVSASPQDTIVASSSLCLAARCAQEKLGFPMATIHLAPSVFRSVIDPPRLPGVILPRWLPMSVKRGFWSFADRFVIDPFVCPRLNDFRAKLGLAPVRSPLGAWWNSPDRVIGMFPEWFAAPQADWPPQLRLSGFPLYDEADLGALPKDVESLLDDRNKPLAFTPGSANFHARKFFETSAATCKLLKRRGILLTRHAEQIPKNLPAGVTHVPYAPLSQLLPHVAALVHHGGIGTTAQALAAGCPQLITWMAHDQLDNAARMQRLGCGRNFSVSAYKPKKAARELSQLIDSPEVQDACRAVAARLDRSEGLEKTCDLLEAMRPQEPAGSVESSGAMSGSS